MNGAVQKLTYDQIRNIAEQLRSKSSSMKTILDNVTAQFNKIGDDSVWGGTAAEAKRAEFKSLAEKFDDFTEAINSCVNYLIKTVELYQSLDSKIQGQ